MKEQLYTIPVTEAFEKDCECPICAMRKTLEDDSIDFTMGNSYMEDDVRILTDKAGFCEKHIKMLYQNQNRLGLALMLNTHLKKVTEDLEKLSKNAQKPSNSLFKKKSESSSVKAYIDNLEQSCYVCSRIDQTFERYLVTIFYLYQREKSFADQFLQSKGICTKHYGLLYDMAPSHLHGIILTDFLCQLNALYFKNMKRMQEDLEWFIDKFDYRNADAPWKNSQDALPRTIAKTNSILNIE